MGKWNDAYERVTQGKNVNDMTPAELREAEKRAEKELDRLLAEEED